jgi:bifunctional N-acetylglucosamine-1-phosphate-uridyltransferase/glucosamine-1-phosphate-acetyltransferase GlmU-like protein
LTHRSATLAPGVVIEGPAVLSRDCTVAPNAYLRGGVFVGERARIGFGSEVKASYLFHGSVLAHLNYAGDSLIGAHANLEAGAVIANHYNERTDKEITVVIDGRAVRTGVEEVGALVGHHARMARTL